MTAVEIPVEKWSGAVREVALGSSYGGGTRTSTVTVGGETALPFLGFEGTMPNRPALAVEIVDREPTDWSPELIKAWGDDLKDPARWAARAVEEGADLIALKLRSCHPDFGDRSASDARATVDRVLAAVGVPLIVYGPGTADNCKDGLMAHVRGALRPAPGMPASRPIPPRS